MQPSNALPSTTHDASDETGQRKLVVDIDAMLFLKSRMSIEDFGRLSRQIARAGAAKRPSELQRLLLQIVRHEAAGEEDAA